MATSSKPVILVINPNTTESMTDALKAPVESLNFKNVDFSYFTAPSGVPSINNEDDAAISAEHCLPLLVKSLSKYDAFLVCCYSQHPLVALLRAALRDSGSRKPVTGIFEASTATCLQSLDPDIKFGIVSTGKQWTEILGDAVAGLLGSQTSARYAGTETTGLNATELHSTPPAEVRKRMKAATKRLLAQDAQAICLGCAGMVGMDVMVREACEEALGEQEGKMVRIVDGVKSGVVFLVGALNAGL